MRILFVASECFPFAKTGGLGDVISALPKALSDKKKDVRIIIPYYKQVLQYFEASESETIEKIRSDGEVRFESNDSITKLYSFNIYRSNLPESSVIIDFLDIEEFFQRDNIYVDDTGKGFSDSAEIYAYFCKAVLENLNHSCNKGWYPDIIHVHDWQTGLIPFFVKNKLINLPKPVKTIFTIHNMAYQGGFSIEKLSFLGIDEDDPISDSIIRQNGKKSISYLKTGIICADIVTTVSETYRDELLTPEFAYGLEQFLKNRKETFYGILNGVDYKSWNPETDKLITQNYSSENQKGKIDCKNILISRFNIKPENKIIIGMVSRLDHQKGFDIILEMLPKLSSEETSNVHIIIVGTGNKKYENNLLELSKKLEFLTVIIGFNNKLAHEIESGSDLFLMPSKFEPCGLNQMYSLKYGTFPIVRQTGGLADTVIDLEKDPESGNGFVFTDYSSEALKNTILRSVRYFNKIQSEKNQYIERVMNLNFSWEISSSKYIDLYKNVPNSKS